MSKRRKKIDAHPDQIAFDFDKRLQAYQEAKEQILEACADAKPPKANEDEKEICVEIAAACKRAIRETDMSREQVVDAINEYFGRSADNDDGRNPLSIHMLNNYLSKPVEYPIPTYYVYAIQVVTDSFEPTRVLVEPMDGKVISGSEVRQMALGKLDETITEMQRLKRELKGKRHG